MHQTKPSIWTHWEDRLPRPNNFKIPEYKLRKEWRDVNINTFPLLSLNCLLDNIYRNPIPDYDAIDSELLRDIFNIIVTAIIYGTSENPNPIYNIFKEGAEKENWDESEMNEFFRILKNIPDSDTSIPSGRDSFKNFFFRFDIEARAPINPNESKMPFSELDEYYFRKKDTNGIPYIEKSESILYHPNAYGIGESSETGGTIYHILRYQVYLLPLIVLLKFKHYLNNRSDPNKPKKMNLHLQQCVPIRTDLANNKRNEPMNYNWDTEKTDGRVGPECEIQSCRIPNISKLNERFIHINNDLTKSNKPKHKDTRYTKDANTGKITKNVTDIDADTISMSCWEGYENVDGTGDHKTSKCEYENTNTREPKYKLMRCKRKIPSLPTRPVSPPTCEQGETLVDNICR